MALTELELKQCEKALQAFLDRRRPPPRLRSEVDLAYRIVGQSVELFEIRPDWDDRSRTHEEPIAKATYVRTRNRWRLFWMRQDLRWHGYEPDREVRSIGRFLEVVEADEYACFFG